MNNSPANPSGSTPASPPETGISGSSFHKLQKRAFGGEDVAARPGAEDDDWWPKGSLLPGVRELIDDFVARTKEAEGLHLVFLLGGAGNGKSFAARELARELGFSPSTDDSLAHRIYRVERDNASVALLNDATIASHQDYEGRQSVALASDIERWWSESAARPLAAFCCVNRGIVIDELKSLAEDAKGIGELAQAILEWLASPGLDIAARIGAEIEAGPGLSLGPHYREQLFRLQGRLVRLSALSVDVCSLLELDDGVSRAGSLFKEIVARCRDDALARPEDCPIRANVQQWLPPNSIMRWEDILAHSEIASGRLHSYRDVWGLAALTLLGPRFATADVSRSLLEHVDICLEIARNTSSPPERLQALLELSHFRLHNALFRSPVPSGREALPSYPPTTPAHLGLALIDPSAWGSPDSRKVEEAMQGIALGQLPSESLQAQGLLGSSWFLFDANLEKSVVEFVGQDGCPDSQRRNLISWLGGYLTRLVGVCNGRLGNGAVIDQWKHCFNTSKHGPARLPIELEKAVRSLIFPQSDLAPRDSILVPAFAARVEPLRLSNDAPRPTLAEVVPHNAVNLQVRRQGIKLVLECILIGQSTPIGQLVLDFPLLREALACRGPRAGQTESTAHVEPRIERCRAGCLAAIPSSQRKLVVVSGGIPVELS